jgi:2,4-dienoyl-CoA reductase-like NADH-dependent reductase (Old Yellow Enzyme family)
MRRLKKELGTDFVIGARVEMESKLAEGLQKEEALEALKIIEADGTIDYFNLNVGRSDTEYMLANYPYLQCLKSWLHFYNWRGRLRTELKTPTIHAGTHL